MADHAASPWSLLLDEMEAELSLAEPNVRSWSAPTNLEPLPRDLVDRARRLLEAQQAAIADLADERMNVARHLGALRIVPSSPGDRSIYLDVLG